jgi:hypothetical protein
MKRRVWQVSLLGILLLFIPLTVVLTMYRYPASKAAEALHAYNLVFPKGVDAQVQKDYSVVIIFKNKNVTDADLDAFAPAFNGYLRVSNRIVGMKLCGSQVSQDALDRFRKMAPDCPVEP